MRKRDLTVEEWKTICRCQIQAEGALDRVGSALLHTLPVRVYDRWAGVRRDLEWRGRSRLTDMVEQQTRMCVIFNFGDEPCDYGWGNPASIRKRPLTKDEWVLVGDDVKRALEKIRDIGMGLQETTNKAQCQFWFGTCDRIGRLKAKLDRVVCSQYPNWPEATRVFYGLPSREDPRLMDSLKPRTPRIYSPT